MSVLLQNTRFSTKRAFFVISYSKEFQKKLTPWLLSFCRFLHGVEPLALALGPLQGRRALLVLTDPGCGRGGSAVRGSEPTRRINAGVKLTDQDMAGIRRIEVQGAQNILTVRR